MWGRVGARFHLHGLLDTDEVSARGMVEIWQGVGVRVCEIWQGVGVRVLVGRAAGQSPWRGSSYAQGAAGRRRWAGPGRVGVLPVRCAPTEAGARQGPPRGSRGTQGQTPEPNLSTDM